MSLYSNVIKEVEASPEGPQIAAFFDFDGTVIHGYSATTYLREQIKRGDIGPRQLRSLANTMIQFGLGNISFSAMLTLASQFLAGVDEAEYLEFAETLYTKHIAKLIYPESHALVEAHLKKGHTVALISAATPYQLIPAARELGIEHLRCSKLEIVDGKFTGEVLKPTCYGMGKVYAAEKLALEYKADMSESFFYSDSDEDIQLLEYVGKPRPLNPNKRLRRIARGRGWPVQDFNSRGKASLADYARTATAQMSLLGSFLAGLPIYAITGSLNQTRNFSTSLFADTASALVGLELDVKGEEHAWGHRPCVFVFNHQSHADTLILPALLRRDLAGVGKKEIGDIPIVGKLMQWAGTVLIDRENAASARESMLPLIDVMLKEGRSVCIAPEGTRSTSTNLGRFKKGAFHIAMQAGVPIVPIVIHNAIDVAPRGQYVLKPATVKVSVLPAVDTSQWTRRNIREHVHQVRDLFLEELDQMQFQPQRESALKAAELASSLRREKLAAKRTKLAQQKKKQEKETKTPVMRVVASQAKASLARKKRATGKIAMVEPKQTTSSKPKRLTRRRRKTNATKVSARTLDE